MTEKATRSILLLGGSKQQVVAIETAKALGYRTVLCDYLSDNPGQYVADVFYQESTTDRDKMLEIARREGVEGVLAYSSDPAAPTAGYVAEALGLPTNPLRSIEILSVKHLFREFLASAGLPCPKAISLNACCTKEEAASAVEPLSFPIVVKPTDSSGSKGVTVVETLGDLPAAIERAGSFSRNGILIAEEYIEREFPFVIGGDVFVVDGEVKFWGIMSCLRDSEGSSLVPVGERMPSGLSNAQMSAVKQVIQKLVDALDIKFGELNIEVLLGKDNTPYILELGARAGGNMIPIELSDASGIDLVAANVLCAMGENPGNVSWEPSDELFATYVLHSNVPGVYGGVRIAEEAKPFLYRLVEYLEQGDSVETFDGANKALGVAFLRFENDFQMRHVISSVGQFVMPIVC